MALKGHRTFSRNFIFKLAVFVMLLLYLMCLFPWKSSLPCCYSIVFLFTYNHPVQSTQAGAEIGVIVLALKQGQNTTLNERDVIYVHNMLKNSVFFHSF